MRKLAISAAAFSIAVILSYFIKVRYLSLVLTVLLCIAGALLFQYRKNRVISAALIVVFSMALGFLYFQVYCSNTVERAIAVSDEELEYAAVVLDYPTEADGYSKVPIRLSNRECRGLKAYIYDYDGRLSVLEPGMRIRFISALSYVGDERFNNRDSLLSSGFFLRGVFSSQVYASGSALSGLHLPVRIKHSIVSLCRKIFLDNSAPFFVSLLTGDKSDLYSLSNVYLDMSRAGFVHIVAVSGMHVAFVVGLFRLLFGKSRIMSLVCVMLIWLFIAVTGFSPSAVRSGIMQTVLLFAPLFKRENDPITSISFALAVILISNPYAALSAGLQLSFGATLGILLFSSRINNAVLSCFSSDALKRVLKYPTGIIAVSLSASFLTVPICVFHYGIVSLISPFTNVMALWAVPICFTGAASVCAISLLSPAAAVILGRILSLFAEHIFGVCRVLSHIPYSSLYTGNVSAVVLLCLIYIAVLFICYSKTSVMFKLLMSSGTVIIFLAMYFTYSFISTRIPKAVYSAVDVGQGQCITAWSEGRSIVIDCGSSSYNYDPGVAAADYLRENCIYSVDTLILTHMHSDHANGVVRLLRMIDTASVVIPASYDSNDEYYSEIIKAAAEEGTEVYLVNQHCLMTVGNMSLELFPAFNEDGTDNETCMAVNVSVDDFNMLITGDSYSDRERELAATFDFSGTDVLIAGHHGSNTSSSELLCRECGGGVAVISCGEDNSYGHPAYGALSTLNEWFEAIFRTDLNGTVSIRCIA